MKIMNACGGNWLLALIDRGERRKSWPVGNGVTTLGRDPGNSIRLVHESISRHHAEISCGVSGILICDTKSRNGIMVNGVPRRKAVLQPGDRLRIGIFDLELVAGPPPEPEPVREPSPDDETEDITFTQESELPDEDRELHTLYFICAWLAEGLEDQDFIPKCLSLLRDAFRSEEAHFYAADGRLLAFAAKDAKKPEVKLAAFLAERSWH